MSRSAWMRAVALAAGTVMYSLATQPAAVPPPDPKASELVQELGLIESPTALREQAGWTSPRKFVLTSMGPLEALEAAAPGVNFVVVNGIEDMVAQVADADAIASGDNVVCNPRVLAAAKRLRWIAVYSAGVE